MISFYLGFYESRHIFVLVTSSNLKYRSQISNILQNYIFKYFEEPSASHPSYLAIRRNFSINR